MEKIDINNVMNSIQNKFLNEQLNNNKEGILVVDSIDEFNKQMNAVPLEELDNYFFNK